MFQRYTGNKNDNDAISTVFSAVATSLIISTGLQPIEKQIVMDQLLQSPEQVKSIKKGTNISLLYGLLQVQLCP